MMQGIGERIKFIRKSRNVTQTAFSKELGISQAYVSRLEKDKENPSDLLINFIAYRYCINREWLKTGNGSMNIDYGIEKNGCINSLHMYSYELEELFNKLNDEQIYQITNSMWCFVSILKQGCDLKKISPKYTMEFIKKTENIYRNLWSIFSKIHGSYQKNANKDIYLSINNTMVQMQKTLTDLYALSKNEIS